MNKLKFPLLFKSLTVFVFALLVLPALKGNTQDLEADNMLMFQRSTGGWSKHLNGKAVNYKKAYSEAEKAEIISIVKDAKDATIDNGATTTEIRHLLLSFQKTGNKAYCLAADRGVEYLLKGQYPSGGWPQFFPDTKGYQKHITYNDNAMINVMKLLNDLAKGKDEMLVLTPKFGARAETAVNKGIACILKTQVVVNGKLTVWCGQHDSETFKPAKARAYEFPSLSGSESANIIDFLMQVKDPSPEIIKAITSAVAWFETSKIEGYEFALVDDEKQPGGKDRVLRPNPNSVLWARFYDLETNQPFFSGRDGIIKSKVSEIELERRLGYAWYGAWGKTLLETKYPKWKERNKI